MREGWKELPISDLLDVSIGGVWGSDPGIDEIDVSVYRQTEFDDDGKLLMPSDAVRSITKNQLKSRRLEAGDVLMQKSAGTPTLPGRVVIVPPEIERNATCSNFLHLLRANTKICNPQFLFWYLWINHQSGRAFEFQRGTNIKNLDLNQYLDQQMMLPPLQEQRRIVDLMSSVDSYLAALQQQADAARSARSAVLSELLSAGGADWTSTTIGDVAELLPGKYVAKSEYVEDGPFFIYGSNSIMGKYSKSLIDVPHTVMAAIGAYAGAVRFSTEPSWVNNNAFGLVTNSRIEPKFLFLWLENVLDLKSVVVGTGQPYVQRPSLKASKIALPPINEQRRIVEIVSSMDDVIQSADKAVTDAKSLRSGLLSDLLSGAHEIPESYDRLLGAA